MKKQKIEQAGFWESFFFFLIILFCTPLGWAGMLFFSLFIAILKKG